MTVEELAEKHGLDAKALKRLIVDLQTRAAEAESDWLPRHWDSAARKASVKKAAQLKKFAKQTRDALHDDAAWITLWPAGANVDMIIELEASLNELVTLADEALAVWGGHQHSGGDIPPWRLEAVFRLARFWLGQGRRKFSESFKREHSGAPWKPKNDCSRFTLSALQIVDPKVTASQCRTAMRKVPGRGHPIRRKRAK